LSIKTRSKGSYQLYNQKTREHGDKLSAKLRESVPENFLIGKHQEYSKSFEGVYKAADLREKSREIFYKKTLTFLPVLIF